MSEFYDEDLERSILSCVLHDQFALSEVSNIVRIEDFYFSHHRDIFKACQEAMQHNEPVTPAFVKKRLGEKFSENIFVDIMATGAVPNVEKYAIELRELSIKRALLDISRDMPQKVTREGSSQEIVDEVTGEIYALVQSQSKGGMKDSQRIVFDLLIEFEKQKQLGDAALVGLDTGFGLLNYATKGFKPGELIILAARPSMGKTTLALNFVLKALNDGHGVVFFSLEMPAEQIMMRLISAKTSIPLSQIISANLQDSDMTNFSAACEWFGNSDFFVYDSGNVNVHQIRNEVRKLISSGNKIDFCVVDYIGLMGNQSSFSERHLQVADISRNLKLLARELEIPILALAQLNRGVESRANKRPMLSDLRESGAIEQDADIIMFVYRGDYYAEQEYKERKARAEQEGRAFDENEFVINKNAEKAEIIIGKNRNGQLTTANVIFQGDKARFLDSRVSDPVPIVEEFAQYDSPVTQ